MKTQSERIIEKFGGITPLAKALGHRHVSTVQGWKDRGEIPQRNWQAILEAGVKEGVKISREDFVAHLPEAQPNNGQAA